MSYTVNGDPSNAAFIGPFPACSVDGLGAPVSTGPATPGPHTVTTCTKATTGVTKVVSSVAACETTNAQGVVKAYVKLWNSYAAEYKVCAQRYDALVSQLAGVVSTGFPGMTILDVHPEALDFVQHGDNANNSFLGPFPPCAVAFPQGNASDTSRTSNGPRPTCPGRGSFRVMSQPDATIRA